MTRLGKDRLGQVVIDEFYNAGMDALHIRRDPKTTTLIVFQRACLTTAAVARISSPSHVQDAVIGVRDSNLRCVGQSGETEPLSGIEELER